MRRALTAIREWQRPRKQQSILEHWWRTYLLTVPVCVLVNLLLRDSWQAGLVSPVWISLCYALGDYAYFHVYGGNDANYPNLPYTALTPPPDAPPRSTAAASPNAASPSPYTK